MLWLHWNILCQIWSSMFLVVVGTPIEYYVASEDTVVAVEYVVAKATSFTFLLQMKIINSTQTRLMEIISYQLNCFVSVLPAM